MYTGKFTLEDMENFRRYLQAVARRNGCRYLWNQRGEYVDLEIRPGYYGVLNIDKIDTLEELWDIGAQITHMVYDYTRGNIKPRIGEFVMPKIDDVIFNYPATIIKWSDGTKTVVKCRYDEFYDMEKGMAMCIAKKALGNKGSYYNQIKKPIEEYEKKEAEELADGLKIGLEDAIENVKKLANAMRNAHNGKTTLPL